MWDTLHCSTRNSVEKSVEKSVEISTKLLNCAPALFVHSEEGKNTSRGKWKCMSVINLWRARGVEGGGPGGRATEGNRTRVKIEFGVANEITRGNRGKGDRSIRISEPRKREGIPE